MPHRSVELIAVRDLKDPEDTDRLAVRLAAWIAGRPSFVLFEGVFFFLNPEVIRRWFEILARIQEP